MNILKRIQIERARNRSKHKNIVYQLRDIEIEVV